MEVAAPTRDELMQRAAKWHDENTLGGADCEHRQLEMLAYVEGYSAALADGVAPTETIGETISPLPRGNSRNDTDGVTRNEGGGDGPAL